MTLKNVLIANAIVAAIFGLGFIFMPELNLEMFEVEVSKTTIVLARVMGGSIFGYTVIAMALSKVAEGTSKATRRGIALGMMLSWVCTGLLDLYAVISGDLGNLTWLSVGFAIIFIALYSRFTFEKD